MKWVVGILALLIPFGIFVAIVCVVAYLIGQRLDEKKKETFEKRDN
jgi:biopolymer transport protein ExbB/TolQ